MSLTLWVRPISCEAREPSRQGWTALERDLIDDVRWWTLQALLATTDRVFPPGLAGFLPAILAGAFPDPPHPIPWG